MRFVSRSNAVCWNPFSSVGKPTFGVSSYVLISIRSVQPFTGERLDEPALFSGKQRADGGENQVVSDGKETVIECFLGYYG